MSSGAVSRRGALPSPAPRASFFLRLAAVAFGAIGVALVSQHVFDMQPCPWCILQRLIYAGIGVVALVAAAWPQRHALYPRRAAALFVGVAATLGVASALWQLLHASKSTSCALTAADRIIGWSRLDLVMPDVFQSRASCAEAAVKLLGLPYAVWSLLLFVVIAGLALRVYFDHRERVDFRDSNFTGATA